MEKLNNKQALYTCYPAKLVILLDIFIIKLYQSYIGIFIPFFWTVSKVPSALISTSAI